VTEVKNEVRQFYDQVGWKMVSEDIYQNARYEDLRPVSREYIHRCHQRVGRHIAASGHLLLDAGSGPIQYVEYLEYSAGYQFRVCADISMTALIEARRRLGDRGLYVLCDVANLPFKEQCFDSLISLHTLHHLPDDDHLRAYGELHRVLVPGASAAIVNGWPAQSSRLMQTFEPVVRLAIRLRNLGRKLSRQEEWSEQDARPRRGKKSATALDEPKGTHSSHHDVRWLKAQVSTRWSVEIYVWRSVSVRFLRNLIHPWLGGKYWLRLLYWLEERYPQYFGENGQYPIIVMYRQ
jgi:ubiquinone/menaquinone biosynthesis C-methylase UbiE